MSAGKVYQSDDGGTLVRYVMDVDDIHPCSRCFFNGHCMKALEDFGWESLKEEFSEIERGLSCGEGHFEMLTDPLEIELRNI